MLSAKCHRFRPMPGLSVVQSVLRKWPTGNKKSKPNIWATSDYRKGGAPDGF